MNLRVSEADLSRVKVVLLPPPSDFGSELQFKQHPNVGKFVANKERMIALKDPARGFPVNQSLAVLKWRYSGKDESYVPLSSAPSLSLLRAKIEELTRMCASQLTAGRRLQMMGRAT